MEAVPLQTQGAAPVRGAERTAAMPVGTPSHAAVALPALEVGQLVTATVVDHLPEGRYLIVLHGALLEASAPAGLQAGMNLALRVDQLKPQVVLQILSAGEGVEAEIFSLLRTRLPAAISAGESVRLLEQELSRFAHQHPEAPSLASMVKLQTLLGSFQPEQAAPTAEQLSSWVRHGGLHYEAKLVRLAQTNPRALAHLVDGDVKGLLLRALTEMLPNHAESTSLLAAMRNHLDHIELFQGLNLLAHAQEEPYQLQIPFLVGQSFATALLTVEPDRQGDARQGGPRERGYRVLFLLDLEGFGRTRIDAHLTSQTLKVLFYIEQDDALTLLRSELPALQETLHSLGYRDVVLEAKAFATLAPEQRRTVNTLALPIPRGVNLVDVKV